MCENKGFYAGFLRYFAHIDMGGMRGHDMFEKSVRIWDASKKPGERGFMKDLMDEDIGALSELDQIIEGGGITREDDRRLRSIKPICKGGHNRGVIYEGCRDFYIVILHDGSISRDLVNFRFYLSGPAAGKE
jgi:hypothetical protein